MIKKYKIYDLPLVEHLHDEGEIRSDDGTIYFIKDGVLYYSYEGMNWESQGFLSEDVFEILPKVDLNNYCECRKPYGDGNNNDKEIAIKQLNHNLIGTTWGEFRDFYFDGIGEVVMYLEHGERVFFNDSNLDEKRSTKHYCLNHKIVGIYPDLTTK